MRVYRTTPGAGIPGLTICDEPDPVARAGEVVVAMRSASLNYRDLVMAGRGSNRPTIPLSDGAGEIVDVGDGVEGWAVGDRVSANFFPGWCDGELRPEYHRAELGGSVDGMLAERVALPAPSLVRLPDSLSLEEAATLPCAAVTAWNALFVAATTRPGSTVLVLGTGGVSIFGLQLARAAGARVILTTSSDHKAERALELGAEAVVNYRTTEAWDQAVLDLTGGRGVDIVLEVGGAGTLPRSLNATATGGTVALIGVLTGFGGEISPWPLVPKAMRLVGVYVGSRSMFDDLVVAVATSDIHPIIDRVFPFDDAPAAYRHLESQTHVGKVVITI